MRYALVALAAAASIEGHSSAAAAQSIARRVDGVREGTVVMRFAARRGVCGDGSGSMWTRQYSSGSGGSSVCVAGPVRVLLGRADNATVSVRVSVGGRWGESPSENDLGMVSAIDAARFLIGLAHTMGGRSGSDAVSAAAMADSAEIAPELTALTRDADAPLDARRQALFWLGETALSTTELARLYDGLQPFALREHFTFVLSQRRDDPAVEKLMDIALHDADHEIRKRAMYWLGQTDHPKALKFLREIVTR